MDKKTIGRLDCIDFPALELFNIDCKIDTGAYTSSIHCSKIIFENNQLKCTFYSEGHPNFNGKEVIFKEYSLTDVKSSNGHIENRYKIKTNVIFFNETHQINLTLSTRDDMRFPVLIGRQFLRKKFIVDVDKKQLSFKQKTT